MTTTAAPKFILTPNRFGGYEDSRNGAEFSKSEARWLAETGKAIITDPQEGHTMKSNTTTKINPNAGVNGTGPVAEPIMQVRLNAAIKRLSTKVGEKEAANGGIVLTSCPKPKSATGTADRVRKELANGRLTGLPTGYVVKSRKADVVVTIAANFHPWDRDAIAARKAETAKPTTKVEKAAKKPTTRQRIKANTAKAVARRDANRTKKVENAAV